MCPPSFFVFFSYTHNTHLWTQQAGVTSTSTPGRARALEITQRPTPTTRTKQTAKFFHKKNPTVNCNGVTTRIRLTDATKRQSPFHLWFSLTRPERPSPKINHRSMVMMMHVDVHKMVKQALAPRPELGEGCRGRGGGGGGGGRSRALGGAPPDSERGLHSTHGGQGGSVSSTVGM